MISHGTMKWEVSPQVQRMSGLPHQENSYDCGVFALAYVDALTEQYRSTGRWDPQVTRQVTPRRVQQFRLQLSTLIRQLATK